ncbi:RNA polymerase sigma factor region1.1 domain-containing protein [Salinarimonas soli]|uniref:RNA polymerase sigma factor 70 region 1.1 domain-containing protein n=1 Tax=Salinarimonas soli TaxID=1638099 RepID=A0A5B2VVJ3_9HYPH|nr:RNA polymerase sigma factor region1.1 domain-containing protein [Salinarimonas soli]KAA2242226.1 hypothetical protein F0L46_02750 [Salinarimonas soli]
MVGFDKAALERLMALGRRRGHLTTGDLEAELPVNAMDPDEIALVIVHLEEAGIPVEVDAALLTGGARPAALRPDEPSIILPAREIAVPPAGPASDTAAAAPVRAPAGAVDEGRAGGGHTHWVVAMGGLLAVAVLIAILVVANSA